MTAIFHGSTGSKNWVGMHASGTAATAFVKAQHWDTTGDGAGDPQEGQTYYDTTAHRMCCWEGAVWVTMDSATIPGGVYVDAVNGSDGTGDGTIGAPYATLAYACAQQADPDPITGMETYLTPVVFHVAPGTYDDDVTFPQRLSISVLLMQAVLEGTHTWALDYSWWDAFSLATTVCPELSITGTAAVAAQRLDGSSVLVQRAKVEACLRNGQLKASNPDPTYSGACPERHRLTVADVARNDYAIYNAPCFTETDHVMPTGPMELTLRDSPIWCDSLLALIGGESEVWDDTWRAWNDIYVVAVRSDVRLVGCCRVVLVDTCNLTAYYDQDIAGAAYTYGKIDGGGIPEITVVRNSFVDSYSHFGAYDPTVAGGVQAITFDLPSMRLFAQWVPDFSAAFNFFSTAYAANAWGRGYWIEGDDANYRTVRVPHCSAATSDVATGLLLADVIKWARTWKPGGAALSAMNRLRIDVEPGVYHFDSDLLVQDVYYVLSGPAGEPLLAGSGGATLEFADTFKCRFSAGYCVIQNFAVTGVNAEILIDAMLYPSTFKNLYVEGAITPSFTAPADPVILGTWEDVHATGAFLPSCTLGASTFRRCSGGEGSFAGGAPNADTGYNEVSEDAVLEDCAAGQYSFGAVSENGDGGDAHFYGQAVRCTAPKYSFGAVAVCEGGAECTGTLIDCGVGDPAADDGCGMFGYSEFGDAVASGRFLRCLETPGLDSWGCFGCNDEVEDKRGTFSGYAVDCNPINKSFGFGGLLGVGGVNVGTLERCTAGSQSFGASGIWGGIARHCRAQGGGSFGVATVYGGMLMEDCTVEDASATAGLGHTVISCGTIRRCRFTASGANVPALFILDTTWGEDHSKAYVYDSEFISTDATSIDGSAGVWAAIAHCRSTGSILPSGTNNVATPYNVTDADIA